MKRPLKKGPVTPYHQLLLVLSASTCKKVLGDSGAPSLSAKKREPLLAVFGNRKARRICAHNAIIACAAILCCAVSRLSVGEPTDGRIHIGAIFSLSGFGAEAGQGELAAINLAAEEINRAGGIQGKRILIRAEDNHSSQKDTATAFHRLASGDGVPVILGPNWAEFAEIAAPLAERARIPILSASANKRGLFDGKSFVFTLFPSYRDLIKPFAEMLAAKSPKRIALFVTENSFCEELADGLREELTQRGMRIWEQFGFNSQNQDYRATLAKAISHDTDAIVAFLLNDGGPTLFLRQADNLRYPRSRIFFGPSLAMDHAILEDKRLAEGVTFFLPMSSSSAAFAEKYRKAMGSPPSHNEAKAYDSVYLVRNAVEQCGESGDKIAACLRKASYTGASGSIEFDKNGQVRSGSGTEGAVMVVKNGEFERLK